jgi:alpha-L-rhamnosidase
MLKYLRFLEADTSGGLRHGGRYGDWLALEAPTSLEAIGTAYLAHSAALFVRMARLLGRDDDADRFARLAARARAAFRRRFTTASGTLGQETQTGYALALAFDLLPRHARSVASGRLANLIEAADGHLLTGFLGTGVVLSALSDHGHHELATRLARQDTFPSWGYEVRQGATTIWERWNAWTPEHGFADPAMSSLNHAALGSVADWLHEYLAGLAPGTPGYRTMLVRPRPADGIDWARASHDSPHGHHSVEWNADPRRLEVTVEVPPNTFADVVLPGTGRTLSVDGQRPRSGARGVVRVASSATERRLTLSWGRYRIEVAR